jgi:branched-chain amino acid aminotransferase
MALSTCIIEPCMAETFEFRDHGLAPHGKSPSLADASGALPPGAYTTLRTYHRNRLLRLDRHVRRLEDSASELGASASRLAMEDVRRAIALALAAAGHPESRLRLTWAPPRLFVSIERFEPPPERLYREGVWCASVPLRRGQPHAKDSRFLATAAGIFERLPAGVYEGLMVAEEGALLEGLSSNFFALREGVLRTEHERVLPGVTRSMVLEVAREFLPVSQQAVRLQDLPSVSEALLTSVSRGIVPVVRIDDRTLGDGRPGATTRDLMRRFGLWAEREAAPV